MSGRYLLDTNVAVALLNGEPAAAARLADASEVFLPTIVLGELYFGAMTSGRPDANASRVSDFAATTILLGVDAETARRYGRLRGDLRRKGLPRASHSRERSLDRREGVSLSELVRLKLSLPYRQTAGWLLVGEAQSRAVPR